MQRKKALTPVWKKKYSYEKMEADIGELKRRYPDCFFDSVIGRSCDDRAIHELTIGNPKARQCILVVGAIHGREYMTSHLCMRQLSYYLAHADRRMDGQRLAYILQDTALHYIPMANPDGVLISQQGAKSIRNHTLRQTLAGYTKKELVHWKANARGVDLNRNFPYHFYVTGQTGLAEYSGKAALSEPESRCLLRRILFLQRQKNLQAVFHYHAAGNEIFGACREEAKACFLTRLLAGLARKETGYPHAQILADTTQPFSNNGNLREQLLYEQEIPSVTIEIGRFSCPNPASEFLFVWHANKNLMIRAAGLLARRG